MKLKTRPFGEIEVDENFMLHIPDGLIGFEEYKNYVLLSNENEYPFSWLQSADEPSLAFVVINPKLIFKDLDFKITSQDKEFLKVKSVNELEALVLVVVPEDITLMSANLKGPVFINTKEKIARQIIVLNEEYEIKNYILEKLQALASSGEGEN